MTAALRAGIVGLGAMGRRHVRGLRALDGVDLVGIADRDGSLLTGADAAPVVATVSQLIDLGVHMCIVSVPTDEHRSVGIQLAAAGVHTLIEKPLSGDVADARCLLEAFRTAGVVACVGHVERYNPALVELRRRLTSGQAGAVYQIETRRQGPFPNRVSDIGAVMDLATHDLDLTAWIAGSSYAQVAAQTARRAERAHEDLVAIVGLLQDGTVTSHLANWLTQFKDRRVAVHGERGCFVADTLTADLVFTAHGHCETAWDAVSTLRGASEGEMTRYELEKREPLVLELAAFRDAILGRGATLVTLDEALATVFVATAVLRSAAAGTVIDLPQEGSTS